jgi:hypothetical protein
MPLVEPVISATLPVKLMAAIPLCRP